jgi:hypothetical protein
MSLFSLEVIHSVHDGYLTFISWLKGIKGFMYLALTYEGSTTNIPLDELSARGDE